MSSTGIKTIVVGADFSKYSKLVVKQARLLGKILGAEIKLVHGTQDFTSFMEPVFSGAETESYLDSLTAKIISFYGGVNGGEKVIVRFGPPAEVLLDVVKKANKPMVMVGNRGLSRVGRFFLGSTSERVALAASCPVWIHHGKKTVSLKKFLNPHDLTKGSDLALNWAEYLSKFQNAKIGVLYAQHGANPLLDFEGWSHLQTVVKKQINHKLKMIKKRHRNIKIVTKNGEPFSVISKESKSSDLIIMATHARETRLPYFGSVTAKVVRQSPVPMLIV